MTKSIGRYHILSPKDKIEIVFGGLKYKGSIGEYCRSHNVHREQFYRWKNKIHSAGLVALSYYGFNITFADEISNLNRENTRLRESIRSQRRTVKNYKDKCRRITNRMESCVQECIKMVQHIRKHEIVIKKFRKYSYNEKLNIIRLIESVSLDIEDATDILGIGKATYFKWNKAYKNQGEFGLIPKPHPYTGLNKLPEHIVNKIIESKKKHPYIGASPMARIITLEESHYISKGTVERIFKRNGLLMSGNPQKKGLIFTPIRHGLFPNDMWITDYSVLFSRGPVTYNLITLMDVYSRYIISWDMVDSQSTHNAIITLEQGIIAARPDIIDYNSIVTLLVDNGPCFKSNKFKAFCRASGIDLQFCRPYNPIQRMRIERSFKTIKEAMRAVRPESVEDYRQFLEEFIFYYNNNRSHDGLNGGTPSDVYHMVAEEALEKYELIKMQTPAKRRLINIAMNSGPGKY